MPIVRIENRHRLGRRENRPYIETRNDPSWREVVDAAFERENLTRNLLMGLDRFNRWRDVVDPDYDPASDLHNYEAWADDLLSARSRAEMRDRKKKIDQEIKAMEILNNASGWVSIPSEIGALVLDPVSLFGFGWAFKGGRTVLRTTMKVSGTTAAVDTGREMALHQNQDTRSLTESTLNVAAATFVAGILGGAAKALTPKARADLEAKIARDLGDDLGDDFPANTNATNDTAPAGVGAESAITTKKQEGIKGLAKTQQVFDKMPDFLTSPVYRGATSVSAYVRRVTEQLADVSLVKNKNTAGIASAHSVENLVKQYDAMEATAAMKIKKQYRLYRQRLAATRRGARDVMDRWMGSKYLSRRDFNEAVTHAGRHNDTHEIAEVQAAAQAVRKTVYDPILKVMQDTGLLDEGEMHVKTADSYVPRRWDRDTISARYSEFARINRDWLISKRDAARVKYDELANGVNLSRALPDDAPEELIALQQHARQTESEIDDVVYQLINRITSLPNGRLDYDMTQDLNPGTRRATGKRGPALARVYDIPDALVKDFVIDDVHALIEGVVRTIGPDAELMRKFGTLEFAPIKRQITEDYARMINKLQRDTTHFRWVDTDQGRFLAKADGAIDLARVSDDVAKAIGQPPAPIRLAQGDEKFGYQHIQQEHGINIKKLTGMGVEQFILDVLQNPLVITEDNNKGNLVFGKRDNNDQVVTISLKPTGNYYTVLTAGIREKGFLDKMRTLWKQPRSTVSQTPLSRLEDRASDGSMSQKRQSGKDKDIDRLRKEQARDIQDVEAMHQKLRNLYAQPDDYAAPQHVLERGLLDVNFMRHLGGATLSSIPDLGRIMMVHGLNKNFIDATRALITDWQSFKATRQGLRVAAVGLDMALATTLKSRVGMDDFISTDERIDNIDNTMTQAFDSLVLINPWNTALKTLAGVIIQNRMMRAILKLSRGEKIPQKELENLASHGIDSAMAEHIASQFEQYGSYSGKVMIPNARLWDDRMAATAFRAAVRKQVDEIIVTPGLDRPLWMSRSGWRLLGQFRSFAFAATQRMMMAGIPQGDAAAVSGLVTAVTLGMLSYAVEMKIADYEMSDDPQVWLAEGVDRSGVTGWFFDVNNIVEKITRGTIGVNALSGGPKISRYASRNVTDAALGPTYGLGQDLINTIGASSVGDWREFDTHRVRRMLPFQNVFYLRQLFDQLEAGVNKRFGIALR